MINSKYIWPIIPKYKITEHDKYGVRKNHYVLFKKREHSGFDITADLETPVYSMTNGVVLKAEFDGTTLEGNDSFNDGYGNKVEILNDDGRRVVYAHLRELLVNSGDMVSQGDIIGKSGCSGGSRVPHLHIEIRKTNTEDTGVKNTINPLEVLPDMNLEDLVEEFKLEPYSNLWKILASETPWDFKKENILYANSKEYIR